MTDPELEATPIYEALIGETLIDPDRWYADCDELLAALKSPSVKGVPAKPKRRPARKQLPPVPGSRS